jgi:hypothetical protein
MNYHSETVSWSSVKNKKDKAYGKRNIVTIKNGKGTKIVETLNSKGKTLKRVKKTLKKDEIANITKGKFMKGFWSNCSMPGHAVCTRG